MRTLKVLSFFNLKSNTGRASFPHSRANLINKPRPTLASQTKKTSKVKIKISEMGDSILEKIIEKIVIKAKISNINRIIKIWFLDFHSLASTSPLIKRMAKKEKESGDRQELKTVRKLMEKRIRIF